MHIPILVSMLQPKLRYLADTSSKLSLDMLWEAYVMVAINLKKARKKHPRQPSKMVKDIPNFKLKI